MTSQQLETLQMMASTLTGRANVYGGPHSYHCYRNLRDLGYVEQVPGIPDWVRITKEGEVALAQEAEGG